MLWLVFLARETPRGSLKKKTRSVKIETKNVESLDEYKIQKRPLAGRPSARRHGHEGMRKL